MDVIDKNRILFSFIIVNWNRVDDLIELLFSIQRQKNKVFETIVVDNASTDNSVVVVSKKFPDVKIIKQQNNIGVTGFNIGVYNAKGAYCILLDNDTLVPESFIDDLKRTIQKYPKITTFALNIVKENGNRQNDYLPNNADKPVFWNNFIGGGVVFLTSYYNKIGGYNPKYFIYINETELSARILMDNNKILFCPNLKIIHKTSKKSRTHDNNYYYFIRNSILFIKTYFKISMKLNLLAGFLLINIKYSIKNYLLSSYLKGIFSGLSTSTYYKSPKKLSGKLEQKFACSWQGNPSFLNILRKKLLNGYP